MAHYAYINSDNIVVQVTVGKDEWEGDMDWEAYYAQGSPFTVRRTSYNTRGGVHFTSNGEPSANQSKAFRKNYAGVGFTWDAERDAFIPPKPFASWVLNESSCLWEPPVPYPDGEGEYQWNEDTVAWEEVSVEHRHQELR